jgi:hypothetical protein
MKAKKSATAKPASRRKAPLASKRKPPSRTRPVRRAGLPEILFEGDRPGSVIPGSNPRLSESVSIVETCQQRPLSELPEAYGTGRIYVTPRDPHWIYAQWDLTLEQLRHYNALSAHGHLVLQILKPDNEAGPATEVHVHPESKYWFVHIAEAGARYVIELGYHAKTGAWTRLATSNPTVVPPDSISPATHATYAVLQSNDDTHEHSQVADEAMADDLPPIPAPTSELGLITSPREGWPSRPDVILSHLPTGQMPSSWAVGQAPRQSGGDSSPT